MLALSIMQPWNWLILEGFKDFENRSTLWTCLKDRQILMHAGKKPFPNYDAVCVEIQKQHGIRIPPIDQLPFGALTGAVTFTGAICVAKGQTPEYPSPWLTGPVGYKCDSPVKRPPMPWRGAQGLFDVPDDIAQKFLFERISRR